jgi:exopolysaccharide biosynthesis WecB/TagA/CpsF family protein
VETAADDLMSQKGDLDGIGYSREPSDRLSAAICRWLQGSRSDTRSVCYVNPHVFVLARERAAVEACLKESDIVAVDGLGFALGVLLLNGHFQTRTVMTPLFDRVLAAECVRSANALLIGGSAAVAAQGAAAINAASRNIRVVEYCDGYQSMAEYLALLRRHPEVEVVLIAMSTPRSEELIVAARPIFAGKLFWSIGGGTLHFYAGTLRRVPNVVSRLGLQWIWRMIHEPAIAPRYLVGIPRFAACLLRALISKAESRSL